MPGKAHAVLDVHGNGKIDDDQTAVDVVPAPLHFPPCVGLAADAWRFGTNAVSTGALTIVNCCQLCGVNQTDT